MQIPRQEHLILKMIRRSVGRLGKHRRRCLERIPGLKVDDACSALSRQNGGWNQIDVTHRQCAHERVIQPFRDLMAQRLHIKNHVVSECAWLRVCCINPGLYPAVRKDPALRQDYQRLKFRRGHAVAKVAIARKLAVRMYWMLRSGVAYAQLVRRQGSPGATLVDASPSLG
jgi:hypothetical protein